jgi:glycosyltransferase involved in cell wall biosynthesis
MKMNMAHIASSSHYNYIMATSPSLFRMIKWFPLLREKVHYVPPPIDITCFSPENKKDQLYYNDLSQTIISYIGPINPKRFALIETLKAVNLLAKKIDFVFTIYTFFRFQEDENTYHFLEKIIDKLHLRKNVKIKNVLLSKDEKARIFRNSSLCLYPIRSFELADPPISILEAMASGSIVATSPINGIPLVLKNNFNGFLINELKTNYLSDLIQHIVECPEKKEIKRNASKTISDHFSYDYVWKKLSELIDE